MPEATKTWRDALDTAKHHLGVLDSILFLIGQSSDHSSTADGYVEVQRIDGRIEETLTERLGQDALVFARRVAWEGWADLHDTLWSVHTANDHVDAAISRTEKLLAVAAAALRVKPFEDPDPLPYDVASGLFALVRDELERVKALYPALQEGGGDDKTAARVVRNYQSGLEIPHPGHFTDTREALADAVKLMSEHRGVLSDRVGELDTTLDAYRKVLSHA